LRQFCNVVFAHTLEVAGDQEKQDFLAELTMPTDPMLQAKLIMGG
jgi:hypothetical protein